MGWMDTLSSCLEGVGAVASIASAVGVPFAGMVEKACNLGGKVLGSAKTLSGLMGGAGQAGGQANYASIGYVPQGGLQQQAAVDNEKEFEKMNDVLTAGFAEMSDHFRSTKGELDEIKTIAAGSFEMIKEMHYLDGIENIDSAHAVFFSNTKDMERKITQFESHRFELEKQYMQHLNPMKITRFLNMLKDEGEEGPEKALAMYNYVMTVEAKYLQMMCVCHINNEDMESLAAQYELFSSHYEKLTKAMVTVLKLDELVNTKNMRSVTKLQQMVMKQDQMGVKNMAPFLTKEIINRAACGRMKDDDLAETHISAVWLASEQGDTAMLSTLMKFGCDVNAVAVDSQGTPLSCLQVAASNGHLEAVNMLLESGARVNFGKNTLLDPSEQGNKDLVETLLAAGEDPNMPGASWMTPLALAQKGSHDDVVALLKAHGAQDQKPEMTKEEKEKKKEKEKKVEEKKKELSKYPDTLTIRNIGNFRSQQDHIRGKYIKMENKVRGKPLWKQEGGSCYLYFNPTNFWMVSHDYNNNAGFIYSGHNLETVPERGWSDPQLVVVSE